MNVFIVLASGGLKPQFWANFDFWELLYRPPFTDEGKIWCAEVNRTSALTCQISSECVHCVGFRWPQTTILGKFWLWGAPVPNPFYRRGLIWCAKADRTTTLTRQILSESVHCVGFRWPKTTILGKFWLFGGSCTDPLLPMRAKSGVLQLTHSTRLRVKICLYRFILSPSGGAKPQFLTFFGLQHLVMSTVGGNLRKLNTGAQLQTFPYPTASKSFLYSNVFIVKLWRSKAWCHKRDTKSVSDKKLNFFAAAAADEIRSPPNLVWW